MLRIGLASVCLAIILAALIAWGLGQVFFFPAVVWPMIVLLGLAFERWRYRRPVSSTPANFKPTGERFEDPETGHIFEVMFDPTSGERRYLDTGDKPLQARS